MKSKKGIEMTMSTIIVAALVLMVLFVLGYMLSDGAKRFSQTSQNCEVNGGTCVSQSDCTGQKLDFKCSNAYVCCTKGSLT